MPRTNISNIRSESKEELFARLKTLQEELLQLRVAKVTSPTPDKLSNFKVIKKDIARIKTIITEKENRALREHFKGNEKRMPKGLRPNTTKKQRLQLNKTQIAKRLKVNGGKKIVKKGLKFALKM